MNKDQAAEDKNETAVDNEMTDSADPTNAADNGQTDAVDNQETNAINNGETDAVENGITDAVDNGVTNAEVAKGPDSDGIDMDDINEAGDLRDYNDEMVARGEGLMTQSEKDRLELPESTVPGEEGETETQKGKHACN